VVFHHDAFGGREGLSVAQIPGIHQGEHQENGEKMFHVSEHLAHKLEIDLNIFKQMTENSPD
jgi:hypothetical protein